MGQTLQELKEVYKLSDAVFEKQLQRIIKEYTEGVKTVEHPTVIIVGAQPGAGKTQLIEEALRDLNRNAVINNADNFRDFHPLAQEINKYHPEHYPSITADYSHRWSMDFQKYCCENKVPYILETTLQNGKGIDAVIQNIKSYGFKVELKILAVNELMSSIGIRARYESQLEREGVGRLVPQNEHDSRYEALGNSIGLLARNKNYDGISIYGRNIIMEGEDDNKSIRLTAKNPYDPLTAYLEERDRIWSNREVVYYQEACEDIIDKMKQRGAEKEQIWEVQDLQLRIDQDNHKSLSI